MGELPLTDLFSFFDLNFSCEIIPKLNYLISRNVDDISEMFSLPIFAFKII